MALGKDEEYLLQNVFTKVEYDELLGKYIIRLNAYLPLKLTPKQRKLLEEICQNNDIELENFPAKLTSREANELFRQYDKLRKEITQNINPQNTNKLKEEAIKVRNKLVEGHLEMMYNFITISMSGKEISNKKEDIFQIGYEVLIDMIESFDVNKGIKFIEYLYRYGLLHHYDLDKAITGISNKDLLLLIKAREKYIKEYGKEPTTKDLSNITEFTTSRVEDLLRLEQLSFTSLDNLLEAFEENRQGERWQSEQNEKEEDNNNGFEHYESSLVDDSYQNQIYTIMFKELICKMLDTLPNDQKEVLTLYYGLNNQNRHSLKEIAEKLKTHHQRVSQLHKQAIENLRFPIRAKYLQEIIKNYTESIYPYMEDNVTEEMNENIFRKRLRELEIFLIPFLPREELNEVLNGIDSLSRNFLTVLFGLNNNTINTRQDIRKELSLTEKSYYRLKEKSMTKLITELRRKYSSNEYLISEEELLDYLMTNYLNRGKGKQK